MSRLLATSLSLASLAVFATPSPLRATVAGKGSPVVLIPGLACSGSVWRETAAHLAERHEVHVLTLPGFAGVAPVRGPFYPGLMNPDATPALMEPRARAVRERLEASGAQLGANLKKTLTEQIRDEHLRDAVVEEAATSSPEVMADAVYGLLTTDLREKVGAIGAPVLLIAAANGQPMEQVTQLYSAQVARAPHATAVVHPTSKHFIMLDEPAFLLTTIDGFLGEAR